MQSVRVAAVQAYKKRKSKASSVINTIHEFKDNQLSVIDTSNTEGKFRICIKIKKANGNDLDIKENGCNDDNNGDKNKEKGN